ncbi:glycosyltransferase [Roseomonas stagni]|uniref:Glycosyltransferase n=1 Tax=Falsiroseomonas algicola TaxID=2716930 RepID=A0A6M1LPM7_9PROT|nr:glycosyltransferase [Falsiroseomonas algicola]NGM22348.1 glycosyltransferase [Falsiroseomonas algicola]
MPFDAMPEGPATAPAPLLWVLPAKCEAPAEIAALRRLGLTVVPFVVEHDAPPAALPRNPLALARATRIAFASRDLPAREALRRGARIAAAFQAWGCGAIHVAGDGATTTAALTGAKLAGAPISVVAEPGFAAAPALRAADIVFATGAAMAEELRALAPATPLRILPPAIAWPAPWATSGAAPADCNGRLLCLDPMAGGAGVPTLLAALASLPPGQRPVVDLIGSGPLFDAWRAEALERGVSDQARFLGARSPGWLATEGPRYLGFIAAAGSVEDSLRAMVLTLPVIGPATAGMREVVAADCGHLVPPGDAQALARALRWLAILPQDQRLLLGEAGRDRVLGRHTMATRAAALARGLAPLLAGAAARLAA